MNIVVWIVCCVCYIIVYLINVILHNKLNEVYIKSYRLVGHKINTIKRIIEPNIETDHFIINNKRKKIHTHANLKKNHTPKHNFHHFSYSLSFLTHPLITFALFHPS